MSAPSEPLPPLTCTLQRSQTFRFRSNSKHPLIRQATMLSSAVSTLLRRSVVAPRSLLLPSVASSSSSSSLPLLFSSLSLQPPPGRLQVRTLSTSPVLATPRPGLLRKKHLGRQPHQARRTEPKTHSGAKARFKSYKNGTVRFFSFQRHSYQLVATWWATADRL